MRYDVKEQDKFYHPLQCRGTGRSSPRRKAVSDEFGIRNAEFGIILFRNFTAKPYFCRDIVKKTPPILSFSDKIGGVRIFYNALRCGTGNRPIQKKCLKYGVRNGRISNPPLRFYGNFRNKNNYTLRIDLIPHSEFLIPNFIYSCSFPLQKQSMYLSMQRSMIFTASSLPFTSSMTVSLPSRDL